MVVNPGHPFQRAQLDSLFGLPWCTTMNQLGLVETVHRLGQRVVVTVTHAAHGRFDANFRQAFGVSNADVLRAPVGVVNQAAVALGLARASTTSRAASRRALYRAGPPNVCTTLRSIDDTSIIPRSSPFIPSLSTSRTRAVSAAPRRHRF